MNKSELSATLRAERDRSEALLASIAATTLTTVELRAGWTIKDLLAHLAAWEAELVLALARLPQNQPPRYVALGAAQVEKLNQRWHQENKGRALDRVLSDFRGVRRQTLRRVAELSERDLCQTGRYGWLGAKTLAAWIAENSSKHEATHREEIHSWWRQNAGENTHA